MSKTSTAQRILVIGACGQIGSELTFALRERYGCESIVIADKAKPSAELCAAGPFESVDVTRRETIERIITKYDIDTIYHMAAILSAKGEKKPQLAWDVNINGLYNILEIAREYELTRVFCPSSMAVFGPDTPCENTPQQTILRPTTMYGITKVTGEMLCNYYFQRFGVDVRGVRYPGIISHETLPGGGTTDYAVEIFYKAIEDQHYTCFLRQDTVLPMMYMPDCIKATIELMEADLSRLKHHADYNLAALSFSPAQLVTAIQQHMPEFTCDYQPDFRQAIADSWPRTIDDNAARREWDWEPGWDLAAMTADMLEKLGQRRVVGQLYR
jgi:nucleoside-diphosphate-sugar epimerase